MRRYIYALHYEEKVFYIGQSSDPHARLTQHLSLARKLLTSKDKLIHKMLCKGIKPSVRILCHCKPSQSYIIEQREILQHINMGHKLTNLIYRTMKFEMIEVSDTKIVIKTGFTHKEILILRLLCNDKTSKEICKSIMLSNKRLDAIRSGMKVKAKVKTLTGLAMYAIKKGFVKI